MPFFKRRMAFSERLNAYGCPVYRDIAAACGVRAFVPFNRSKDVQMMLGDSIHVANAGMTLAAALACIVFESE